MKRIIAYSLLLLAAWTQAQAQSPAELFEAGNAAYEAEQYEEALTLYDSVLNQAYRSADLYYNLGNAHYKLGHIAPAILNYERALQLDPSHDDATFNLQLANLRVVDNLKPVPRLLLMRQVTSWYNSRSSSQWAWLAFWVLWVSAGLGILFIFMKSPMIKRIGFFGGVALLLFSLLCLGLGYQQLQKESDRERGEAIIVTSNAYVKDAPNGKTDLLILHEGVKVRLEEQHGNWVKIYLHDANIGELVGFVEAKTVRRI